MLGATTIARRPYTHVSTGAGGHTVFWAVADSSSGAGADV
jgi:hypothetical protein